MYFLMRFMGFGWIVDKFCVYADLIIIHSQTQRGGISMLEPMKTIITKIIIN